MTLPISQLHPSGIQLIDLQAQVDSRGIFVESVRQKEIQAALSDGLPLVQSNWSMSYQHVLRGLHFQIRRPQGKLIHLLAGRILDVAVDIRLDSAYFGQSYQILLDAKDYQQLWIPPGFAHGFLVLSQTAQLVYHCTDYYDAQDQGCLKWNDSCLKIDWNIDKPILSKRDKLGQSLQMLFGRTP